MSVEALAHQATASYGRFADAPSRSELERFFFLDDHDRALLEQRRRPHSRLGFALQLGTVRFLGRFLADPLDVPSEVIEYVAGQLGVDPACVGAYTEREKTAYEHSWEIRRQFGYREFGEAELELREFLAARAWTSVEGPRDLLDRATAWLVEHKVLLPGLTTLEKLVTAVRTEAADRLCLLIVDGVDIVLRDRLNGTLEVATGSRFSDLERLRTSPARITGTELERALLRVGDVRQLGVGGVDLSALPGNRGWRSPGMA